MYHIGQFRRPQLNSYAVDLEMELSRQESGEETEGQFIFYDIGGLLSGDNIVNSQNCYYLRFGVKQREDSEQSFYLKLKNTTEEDDNEQLIKEFKVTRGTSIVYFETIIAPNATYDQILWELQRTALDYSMVNADGTYGRIA